MRCVREKKSFQVPATNFYRNVTDLAGSLVTSSRPPDRPQKRPDVVCTADGSWQTADAADEQRVEVLELSWALLEYEPEIGILGPCPIEVQEQSGCQGVRRSNTLKAGVYFTNK